MELSLHTPRLYRVKRGQRLGDVAAAFSLPERAVAAVNGLTEEIFEGQLLILPEGGDLYTVRGGESKTLLCGSAARFAEKNKTERFYVGQKILL